MKKGLQKHNDRKSTSSSTNLITSVDVPDTQDFIKITLCDGTIQTIWLNQYQLPEFDYKTDTKPNLPVLSLSRFLEKVMTTITQAFY